MKVERGPFLFPETPLTCQSLFKGSVSRFDGEKVVLHGFSLFCVIDFLDEPEVPFNCVPIVSSEGECTFYRVWLTEDSRSLHLFGLSPLRVEGHEVLCMSEGTFSRFCSLHHVLCVHGGCWSHCFSLYREMAAYFHLDVIPFLVASVLKGESGESREKGEYVGKCERVSDDVVGLFHSLYDRGPEFSVSLSFLYRELCSLLSFFGFLSPYSRQSTSSLSLLESELFCFGQLRKPFRDFLQFVNSSCNVRTEDREEGEDREKGEDREEGDGSDCISAYGVKVLRSLVIVVARCLQRCGYSLSGVDGACGMKSFMYLVSFSSQSGNNKDTSAASKDTEVSSHRGKSSDKDKDRDKVNTRDKDSTTNKDKDKDRDKANTRDKDKDRDKVNTRDKDRDTGTQDDIYHSFFVSFSELQSVLTRYQRDLGITEDHCGMKTLKSLFDSILCHEGDIVSNMASVGVYVSEVTVQSGTFEKIDPDLYVSQDMKVTPQTSSKSNPHQIGESEEIERLIQRASTSVTLTSVHPSNNDDTNTATASKYTQQPPKQPQQQSQQQPIQPLQQPQLPKQPQQPLQQTLVQGSVQNTNQAANQTNNQTDNQKLRQAQIVSQVNKLKGTNTSKSDSMSKSPSTITSMGILCDIINPILSQIPCPSSVLFESETVVMSQSQYAYHSVCGLNDISNDLSRLCAEVYRYSESIDADANEIKSSCESTHSSIDSIIRMSESVESSIESLRSRTNKDILQTSFLVISFLLMVLWLLFSVFIKK